MNRLSTRNLTLSYGRENVIESLDLDLIPGRITALIGRNGSGKSTLLRALARLMKAKEGAALLDGVEIARLSTKEVARRMAVLPQSPTAPEGITVLQLVKQGRFPHQSWRRQWSDEDERAVREAMEATSVTELADRPVDSLSGGQRQRVWIAMTLAQETSTILLDEPTTYLDLAHQIEVLELLRRLHEEAGKTIIMVLHDLNLAARYAHHVVAVHHRTVYAQGSPAEVICPEILRRVFSLLCEVSRDPISGCPLCIPFGTARDDEQPSPATSVATGVR